MEPFEIDITELQARLESPEYAPVLQSLTDVGYGSVPELLGTFAATGEQLKQWLADAQINRDRNLRLQYLAGLGINNYEQAGIYSEILRQGSWPEQVFTGELSQLSVLRSTIRAGRP